MAPLESTSHTSPGAFIYVCLGLMHMVACCYGHDANGIASFVFGDSLVDAGNNHYLPSLARADYLPFGVDFLPYKLPTGRFTNGRTVPDILGQELGVEEYASPYLAPSTQLFGAPYGVNYASGGGGILNQTGEIFIARLNLAAQIDNYANTRHDMIVNDAAAPALLRRSIFSVTIGSNDFINNYLSPLPGRTSEAPETFIESLISIYKLQLTRLYDLDARMIVVVNVGPIGCTPYLRGKNLSPGSCSEAANRLAQRFNERLKQIVVELPSMLTDATILYANIYHIVSDIIENYISYGFEVADSACCSFDGEFMGLVPCLPVSKVCADRSKYVFWDPYHPSESTNVIIAKRLLDGGSDDIFPINVRKLVEA